MSEVPGAQSSEYDVSGARGYSTSEFLREASHARRVSVNLGDRLAELDGLRHLRPDLDALGLSAIWVRSPSLRPLSRFGDLRDLSLDGDGRLGDMGVLGGLESVEVLRLGRRADLDLAVIARLPRLWYLELSFGSLSSPVATLLEAPALRWLDISWIRSLSGLDGVGAMRQLEGLSLGQLSRLDALPDLSGATGLRTVVIEKCRGIRDLSALAAAPSLERLFLVDMPQITVDDVRVLAGHPTLRSASVGTGSMRRNREIQDVLGLPEAQGPWMPGPPGQ